MKWQEEQFAQTVLQLMQAVGEFQLNSRQGKIAIEEKSANDLVSHVDCESEAMLRKALLPLIPGSSFWGEEGGRDASGDCEYEWIVDPLDGTTNYLMGLDQFSISIALLEQGQPVFGMVYRPHSNEYWQAVRGAGMQRNGNFIAPPQQQGGLRTALVGTGFPYRSADLRKQFFSAAEAMMTRCRDLRRFGSAALDLSNLAEGALQGFWESDLQPYDVAAALVMMSENGITCTNHLGQPYDFRRDRMLIAAPANVHTDLQVLMRKHYGEEQLQVED